MAADSINSVSQNVPNKVRFPLMSLQKEIIIMTHVSALMFYFIVKQDLKSSFDFKVLSWINSTCATIILN